MKPTKLAALFFDLDGTLLDTAPDIANAMNTVLQRHSKKPIAINENNYHIFGSSSELLALELGMTLSDPHFDNIKQEFFTEYFNNIAHQTHYYSGIESTLITLNQHNIPWGIITNKPEFLTRELIKQFPLLTDTQVCIAGDTLPQSKPSPVPLLHACQTLKVTPEQCCYVGDSETDCIAAKKANMYSITMLYGYRKKGDNPTQWQTDSCFDTGEQLHTWLTQTLNATT